MSYRIGIIGCGGQGKAHAKEWAQLENCEVVAVADPLPEPLAWMQEQFPGVTAYATHAEMIAQEPLDIVSIATWPDQHAAPTIMAAEHGLHVMCEKPMALDLQECDAMIEACERNQVALVISHNRRNDPRYWKLKRMLEDGAIGKLCRVHAADKGYEVGYGLMNIGTHIFDGLRMMLGDVQKVFAHLTVDGRDLTPADICTEGPRGTGWVAGKEGTVVLHFRSGDEAIVEWDPEVNRFSAEYIGTTGRLRLIPPKHDLYHFPHATLNADNQGDWRQVELTPEENPYDYPAQSTREDMLRKMLTWIEGGRRYSDSDGQQGRAALEIISAVYWSVMRGGWVELPLSDTRHPLKVWRGEA
jgi:predicted dehydrogenase